MEEMSPLRIYGIRLHSSGLQKNFPESRANHLQGTKDLSLTNDYRTIILRPSEDLVKYFIRNTIVFECFLTFPQSQ